jgi:hypothetical protein
MRSIFRGEKAMISACSACCLIHADFYLGLIFDPEDVGNKFLRKIN